MQQAKATIDFFEYLSRERILSQDVLRDLRRITFESVPQIGRILLDRGVMDVRQVMQIVGQQADSPQVRFGELAVRAGYLSRDDLYLALREQHQLRRHPAEILRERGLLDDEGVFKALIGFVKFQEIQTLRVE